MFQIPRETLEDVYPTPKPRYLNRKYMFLYIIQPNVQPILSEILKIDNN